MLALDLLCPKVLLAPLLQNSSLYGEDRETTRDDDSKDQQVLVLESNTNSGGSTNNDTGKADPPYWILSRGR